MRANLDPDWDPSLKPDIQQELWNCDALVQINNDADDVVERPNKRQQGKRIFPSPDTSHSIMPPPAALSQFQMDRVRTPRPNFTIGFRHSTVSNVLIMRGLSEFKADDFLQGLQHQRKLCSDPMLNFSGIRFPILVIEGKAYATGKTAFEAQNQAVVSGACMVNLRQQLTDLFESVFPILKAERHLLPFQYVQKVPRSNCGYIISCWSTTCAATT